MKKSMKLISIVSFIFLLMLLAACGTSETGTKDNNQGSQGEQTEPKGQDNETPEKKKKLLVGTDAAFAPFEYMDKGEIVGFDIDLIAAIMEEAGYEYEVNNHGWDPLFAALLGKQIDVAISAITITDDRAQSYDFSNPYFESTHMIVFKEGTEISSALDIEGKRIGVQNATTGQTAAEKVVGENHSSIAKYENTAMAFLALQNGDVEVVVTDNVVAQEYVKNNPEANVLAVEDPVNFEAEYYGLMLQKGSSELKADIDAALKTVLENGTYATIFEKWFGYEPDVTTLLEQAK